MKKRIYKIFTTIILTTVILMTYGCRKEPIYQDSSQTEESQLSYQEDQSQENQNQEDMLDLLFDNIKAGGPRIDGIPPVDEPKYISIEKADVFLSAKDVVFVVEHNKNVYIYPQNILVWHEIVNENLDDKKISITYCPLTGSTIGYKGNISNLDTTFGTSGKLVNSNLVMYDRETMSYIPQILGVAIQGDLKGERLEEFPIICVIGQANLQGVRQNNLQ